MSESFKSPEKENLDHHLEFFARMISHNLRSPMAGLKMLLELYPKMPDENSKDEIVGNIKEGAEQLFGMIDDLAALMLDYKELITPRESLELKEIYSGVREELNNSITNQEAEIVCQFEDLPEVEYYENHLRIIFRKLIDNALRFRAPERKLKLQIRSFVKDGWATLSFCDNGSGMDLNTQQSQLFKMYKTYHRQGQNGRGTGLFTVKNIVEIQGGKIWVESQPDKGSCFYLQLYRL